MTKLSACLVIALVSVVQCFSQTEVGSGTLLMLYSTKDSIFLCIDSKTTYTSDTSAGYKQKDKLGKVGGIHFGSSGISYIKLNNKILFETKQFFETRLISYPNISAAVNYLSTNASRELQHAIQNAFNAGAKMDNNATDLDIFICTFEGNIPNCWVVNFWVEIKNQTAFVSFGQKIKFENFKLEKTGYVRFVDEYVKKNNQTLLNLKSNTRSELLNIFRHVIQNEKGVGYPIVIRNIYLKGYFDVKSSK